MAASQVRSPPWACSHRPELTGQEALDLARMLDARNTATAVLLAA